jgi:serpin B
MPANTGCHPSAIAAIDELRSLIARSPAGPNALEGVESVAAADAEFAFRLFHELTADSGENVFFSPYSISTALSMTLAGARGNTAAEMRAVLGVEDDQAWHDARNRLELALLKSEGRSLPHHGNAVPLTLETTNAIFGQRDYAFRNPFLDLLAANYGAGMQTVDFISAYEAARLAINDWVAQRTRDRIPVLLAPGLIDDLSRLVLVNAIFFRANWVEQFDPSRTTDEAFHRLDGSTVDVAMMHASPRTAYESRPGWAATVLPYWGSASMTVIVPDEGRFAEVERALTPEFLSAIDPNSDWIVHLSLPKWESESTIDLKPLLQQLGMVDAFIWGTADFSGIADFSQTGEPDLVITDAVHQASITVDEEGTEASAATAVVVGLESVPPEATLTIDRPFIYLIRDDLTGEILFLGRFLGPDA